MKIYVCYGTWTAGAPVHRHPCGEAHKALVDGGHRPEVIRSYGLGPLPAAVNGLTRGRREVKELTGNYWVPVLVTDDGTVIQGSKKIIAWARANPLEPAGTRGSASAPAPAP
jgi:Glutathione S-transferase, N-terminal domain